MLFYFQNCNTGYPTFRYGYPIWKFNYFLSTLILSAFFLCFMMFGCMVFSFMVVFGVILMLMVAHVSFSFVGVRV